MVNRGTLLRRGALIVVGIALVPAAIGCKPNLDDTVSIITSPQIVAVNAQPAEAAPTGTVQYTALYVGPSGTLSIGAIDWAFCTERKSLAELEPVSPMCLESSGSWFVPIGVGNSVSGSIPSDACGQFGPDVPQPQPGQPPGRPVDPDSTGGYYQPVRLAAAGASGDVIAIAQTRISCGLANATPNVAAEFAQRYHANVNPAVSSFGPVGASWVDDSMGGSNSGVSPGQHLNLEVAWPACPVTDACGDGICGPDETASTCMGCSPGVVACPMDCPMSGATPGCQGAERYVVFDNGSGALSDAREGMGVAWYATGGAFDVDRTGRAGSDMTPTSDNGWTAPSQPGNVTIWIVLRDDRGGSSWAEYVVAVQ